ncbi:hypothetical protein HDU84_002412 [Entophlyctis sp. JEL0112]|nr:hypothetical protein HDU84_002412 [Entophlyctis sp. JEL0112]
MFDQASANLQESLPVATGTHAPDAVALPFDSDAIFGRVRDAYTALHSRLIELSTEIGNLQSDIILSIQTAAEQSFHELAYEFNLRVSEVAALEAAAKAAEDKLRNFYKALMNSFDEFFVDDPSADAGKPVQAAESGEITNTSENDLEDNSGDTGNQWEGIVDGGEFTA